MLYAKNTQNPKARTACIPTSQIQVSFDCTVECSVDCSLLHNIPILFFMRAASLWPWATRPGCFSHVIAFSAIFI